MESTSSSPSPRRARWPRPALVFTTHTPVPAGHDYFPADLMDRYFGDYCAGLGLSRARVPGLWAGSNPATTASRSA